MSLEGIERPMPDFASFRLWRFGEESNLNLRDFTPALVPHELPNQFE